MGVGNAFIIGVGVAINVFIACIAGLIAGGHFLMVPSNWGIS